MEHGPRSLSLTITNFCERSLQWPSNAVFNPSIFPREMLTHFISFSFQRLKNSIYLCDVDAVTISRLM